MIAGRDALIDASMIRRVIEEYGRPPARRPGDAGIDRKLKTLTLPPPATTTPAGGPNNASVKHHHDSSVLSKVGLRDRIQAVVFACESGLVEPARP